MDHQTGWNDSRLVTDRADEERLMLDKVFIQRPVNTAQAKITEYIDPDRSGLTSTWRNFVPYMIETKRYGHYVCYGMPELEYNWDQHYLHTNPAMIWSILNCPWRIVAFPLAIRSYRLRKGHANIVIVNKRVEPWEIERFEPHGGDEFFRETQEIIDHQLSAWFRAELSAHKIRINYLTPADVCPHPGPQTRAESNKMYDDGFCQTWVLLYLDIRLSNPHLTNKQVMFHFLKLSARDLYDMVQEYATLMANTRIPQTFQDYLLLRSHVYDQYKDLVPYTTSVFSERFPEEIFKVIADAPADKETFRILNIILSDLQRYILVQEPLDPTDILFLMDTIAGKGLSIRKPSDTFLEWLGGSKPHKPWSLREWTNSGKRSDLRSALDRLVMIDKNDMPDMFDQEEAL